MQYSSISRLATAAAVSTVLLSSSVSAHGYLIQPETTYGNTNYTALIDSSTLPAPYAGKTWDDGSPAVHLKSFMAAFAESGSKTIRPMLDKAAPGCGHTRVNGTAVNVSGLKTLVWANHQDEQGFLDTHWGPCETWIDDIMVQQDSNCVTKYPGYPANVPIDYSVCKKDKCTLTFYWLALHEPMWQVYKHCAPISNKGGYVGKTFAEIVSAPGFVSGHKEARSFASNGTAGSHAGSRNHSSSVGADDVGSKAPASQMPKPSSSATSAGLVSPALVFMLLGAWGLEH